MSQADPPGGIVAALVRARGVVQGVGFRPAVWRLARRLGLHGWVANDGDGVCIRLVSSARVIDDFTSRLRVEAPPLARIAACLAENGVAPGAAPALGIALDGLGYGTDGTIWGGEFLLADYRGCERLATLRPVAMPSGAQAIHEPWRNTYAHIVAALGWDRFAAECGDTGIFRFLQARPRATLDAMIARGVNSPRASSCGCLFDAVAGSPVAASARSRMRRYLRTTAGSRSGRR